MARMIPSIISPDVKSRAEIKIFKWFQEAKETEDWIVLHSLNLPQHEKVIDGEADFVVIAPKYGIFVLEVKGGRVKRDNGIWYFTNKYGKTTSKSRGPFEQAKEAINSIMIQVRKRADVNHNHVADIFYGYGVMVPDVDYDTMGVDEESWMIFDCQDDNKVRDYIIRIFNGWKNRWEETYGELFGDKLPTVQDVKYIANILRRDFDKGVSILARINNTDAELFELTERQYKCIDQLEENRRGVIYGPAGTGKTLLAIRQAETSVSSGKKVALLCFNSSISQLFNYHFKIAKPDLKPAYVGTFHKLLMEVINNEGKKVVVPCGQEAMKIFYEEELPRKAIEVLLERTMEFDEIIIDEAQDLIRDNYLDVLDLLLKRGFEHGCWKFFGDFSRQALYTDGMAGKDLIELIENRTSFIRYKLTENCRNTRQICDDIQTITGYEYQKELWTKVDGVPVEHKICTSEEEEINKLILTLTELNERNVPNDKITILSPRTRDNSMVSKIEEIEIKNYDFKDTNCISFSTIQSFKGLDNSVIILVDINSYSAKNLMYVALSRAKSALFILETKSAHAEYNDLLKRRLING